LLKEGLDFSKHSGVIASIHQRFVKTGKLSKEQGKDLNWLFEIRNVGGLWGYGTRVSATSGSGYSGCGEFLESHQVLAQQMNKGKTLPTE